MRKGRQEKYASHRRPIELSHGLRAQGKENIQKPCRIDLILNTIGALPDNELFKLALLRSLP